MSRFFEKSLNKSGFNSTNEGALKKCEFLFPKAYITFLKKPIKIYQLKYIKN